MSHAVFLRAEIFLVVFVWCDFDRDVFHYFQSVALESYSLDWVIGEQTDLTDAKVSQDLCSYSVVPQVGLESEMDVGIDGVKSFFLEFVGCYLVHQTDSTSFLTEIYYGSLASLLNELHGFVELFAAVASA